MTLANLVSDVQASLLGYGQVKDKPLYLAADITSGATSFTLSSQAEAKSVQAGQFIEFCDTTFANEIVRVRSVDTTTLIVTIDRALRGTTAQAWAAATARMSLEPEYPVMDIIREINNTITGLPPDIWAIKTTTTTVQSFDVVGYAVDPSAVGILSVQYLPVGPSNAWQEVRRFRFNRAANIVDVFQVMQPGQALKIVYRAYPTGLSAVSDDLVTTAGLTDSMRQLVVWGALYRLLASRAPARLVDSRAETPMNQQYRQADPVNAAVRQVFQIYRERVEAERERQRLEWPVRFTYTF